MDQAQLARWIERLNKSDKKEYEAIVTEMAKENTLKQTDAWKLLKLAGFDPAGKSKSDKQSQPDGAKQAVILRHKTGYPGYRRAGLVLTQKAAAYEVTEEQLAALKNDPWVVVGGKKDGEKK